MTIMVDLISTLNNFKNNIDKIQKKVNKMKDFVDYIEKVQEEEKTDIDFDFIVDKINIIEEDVKLIKEYYQKDMDKIIEIVTLENNNYKEVIVQINSVLNNIENDIVYIKRENG